MQSFKAGKVIQNIAQNIIPVLRSQNQMTHYRTIHSSYEKLISVKFKLALQMTHVEKIL